MDDLEKYNSAVSYVVDFAERFFPGTDIESGKLKPLRFSDNTLTTNMLPYLVYSIYSYLYFQGYNDILWKLIDAALTIQCKTNSGIISYDMCLESQMILKSVEDNLKPKEG
jgi:hypothetical protein